MRCTNLSGVVCRSRDEQNPRYDRDIHLYNVACLLCVLPNTSGIEMSSELKIKAGVASLSCFHTCSICQVEQMSMSRAVILKTTSRCCRYRYHAVCSIRRTHICASHSKEYIENCELFIRMWPILSVWIARNYEAALSAMARRAFDALAALDGMSSSSSDIPALVSSSSSSIRGDIPARVSSSSSSIREDVPDVEEDESSDEGWF